MHEVLIPAVHQFPVIGGDLARPKRLGGGAAGLVAGIAGSLYGGLGVAQAFQYAASTVRAVPCNSRPDPVKAPGRSVLLLATAGLAVLGTTALSIAGGGGAGAPGTAARFLALAASAWIDIAVAIFAFRFAPACVPVHHGRGRPALRGDQRRARQPPAPQVTAHPLH